MKIRDFIMLLVGLVPVVSLVLQIMKVEIISTYQMAFAALNLISIGILVGYVVWLYYNRNKYKFNYLSLFVIGLTSFYSIVITSQVLTAIVRNVM